VLLLAQREQPINRWLRSGQLYSWDWIRILKS